jgi:hypothetical protein
MSLENFTRFLTNHHLTSKFSKCLELPCQAGSCDSNDIGLLKTSKIGVSSDSIPLFRGCCVFVVQACDLFYDGIPQSFYPVIVNLPTFKVAHIK